MNLPHHGSEFFDADGVFDRYSDRRGRSESPNDTLEAPVIRELLGKVDGLDVLDLGCGDGAFGIELLQAGARSYTGVDSSRRMIESASILLRDTAAASASQCVLETWEPPAHSFDRVTARLVLHYIEDLPRLFTRVHRALRSGGAIVFSVEHPVITSSDKASAAGSERQDWIVDGYFSKGARVTRWMGQDVVRYHRTVEDHFNALVAAGFSVDALRESDPRRDRFQDEATFRRRQRIPLFLFMAGRKS